VTPSTLGTLIGNELGENSNAETSKVND